MLREDVTDPATGEALAKSGERIDASMAEAIGKLNLKEIMVLSFVTEETEYLSADVEDRFVIAQANTPLNEYGEFIRKRVSSRSHSDFTFSLSDSINYMDVAPHQIVGISAALIPFLEHDGADSL